MKIRYLIGMVIVITLILHLAAGGLVGSQSQGTIQNRIIEKAIPPTAIQNPLTPGEQFEEDKSIFSKTTIISLIAAVMGIVAFRRNTYS